MLANILLKNLPLTPGVGSKVKSFSFLKVVMLYNQIRMIHANVLPFYTPLTLVWGQRVKHFFSEEGYVAYHIMQLDV